jgi:endonuclease VIII
VPEGDTILWAATRIRPVLVGQVPDAIETAHPRHLKDRWPERLAGRVVQSVDTHGKNLFLVFEGELVLHSHLRMTGAWDVRPIGGRWIRSPRRAWLMLRRGDSEVVQFDGPVLELMTGGRRRFDQRLAGLGPDVLAPSFDERLFLARLRADDPTRAIGDALIDQRNVAGIGNIWKSEGCWEAGIDPWRRARDVSDEEARAVIDLVRPRMLESGRRGARSMRTRVYRRSGMPCPRCGAAVRSAAQGDANRMTYWCPGCQH